jgi:hypothetical protein
MLTSWRQHNTDMAIWQFRLEFVPEEALLKRCGVMPRDIPKEIAANCSWWDDIQVPEKLGNWIRAILPEAESWSESMRIWGHEDGNDVSVCYADEHKKSIKEISCRVDVRNISVSFIRDICALARALKCVLVTAKNEVLQSDESAVYAAIYNSTAKKYLEDPVSALRNLESDQIVELPEKLDDEPPV